MKVEGFIPAEKFADILSSWYEVNVELEDIERDELADGFIVKLDVDSDYQDRINLS